MPDTKIAKTPSGWVDLDRPTAAYRVRRLAREARRQELIKAGKLQPKTGNRVRHRNNRVTTTTTTTIGVSAHPGQQPTTVNLNGLQQKLFDRLTNGQNVSKDDALEVIVNNGYNKSASYGHMREAGANHNEAKIVISLDNPPVSLAYGIARAKGMNHTDALNHALKT